VHGAAWTLFVGQMCGSVDDFV